MVRPIKKNQIPNLRDAIKQTAWSQIAEYGAPSLSLRAIARELKISAPAIYNYFPDRDALVTALIIDAYQSFGDSQLEARDAVPVNIRDAWCNRHGVSRLGVHISTKISVDLWHAHSWLRSSEMEVLLSARPQRPLQRRGTNAVES
jgi:AcrR family transcriptional regulator